MSEGLLPEEEAEEEEAEIQADTAGFAQSLAWEYSQQTPEGLEEAAKFLRDQRRYAILILFVLAEIITPPDMFSCLLVFIPLYILFEISVHISARAVERAKNKK